MSKIKLTLYFKSGNKIQVVCDSYNFKYNSSTLEFSSYELSGCKPNVSFVPHMLEAYTSE